MESSLLEKMLSVILDVIQNHVTWKTVLSCPSYTLQTVQEKHFRIVDQRGRIIATGTKASMHARFSYLTRYEMTAKAKFGDVIGVHRKDYDHYGIYESDECVYEYATDGGDLGSEQSKNCLKKLKYGHENAYIRRNTLSGFIGESDGYFVLDFAEQSNAPKRIESSFENRKSLTSVISDTKSDTSTLSATIADALKELRKSTNYHIYSPEETVHRAKEMLGKKRGEYNFVTNNCEHFALWCKTGVGESNQVSDTVLWLLNKAAQGAIIVVNSL